MLSSRYTFQISLNAMKSQINEVALQGIEFWSNVCEEEISLSVEAEEAREQGRAPESVSRHYARGMSYLVYWLVMVGIGIYA